jgi:Trk-type K+ transport system membrane component
MYLYEWCRDNEVVLAWLGLMSVVMFFATILAIPFIVARIPTDYFVREHQPCRHTPRSPNRLLWVVVKNVFGIILLLAGLAMLVLPGQGVLTILLGIMLMNFPGKYELERRIIQQPTVLKALTWIRHRANRPALIVALPATTDERFVSCRQARGERDLSDV